ncbi:MAG: transcription termination factor NusA [bacterium]
MTKEESPIKQAIQQICEEKNISYESVLATIEAALAVAYRKDFGEKNQNIKAKFDVDSGTAQVFDVKTVVEDELKAQAEAEREERERLKEESGEEGVKTDKEKESDKKDDQAKESKDAKEDEEVVAPRWDPKTMITLTEAKELKKDAALDEEIRTELFPPSAYGRMAAQTAKQVIVQRLREAERDTIFQEFKGKEGEIFSGVVQRVEGKMVLMDLGHATALMPPPEQVDREQYTSGLRMKIFIVSVNMTSKGPEIIVSRSHPEMVRRFFTVEVPEVQSGAVEIKALSREAGSRTKVAVFSDQKNIDPVGSCVGQRGTRVQTIIAELNGEKIDIIEWSNDPIKFISNALSPAKVLSIKLNEKEKSAVAEVKEDQLSLAIGKNGQNVRLAAKLTGWKIDIVGEGKENSDDKPDDEGGSEKNSEKKDEKKEDDKAGDKQDKVATETESEPDKKQGPTEDKYAKEEKAEKNTDNKESIEDSTSEKPAKAEKKTKKDKKSDNKTEVPKPEEPNKTEDQNKPDLKKDTDK